MPSKKPEVNKKARDKWYHTNRIHQITRQIARRKELTLWLWEYKRTLYCVDCPFSFKEHPEALDFHHLDPSKKEGSPRQMILSSRQKLLKELEKCVPLCATCHRIRHADLFTPTLAQ